MLAAIIGALGASVSVAGVGHAYLREWRRAATWFAFVLVSELILYFAFADPGTSRVADLPLAVVLPAVSLLSLSIVDAYYVARRGRRSADPDALFCPLCGGQVDPAIDFCPWCAERLIFPGRY
jgi:hypothetical protein